MSLVSSSIPNFVNGVSQQPFTMRLSSQGSLQENGLSTVSAGLQKRPPTEHLAKISASPLATAAVHMIDRDGTERYQVIVTNGLIQVYGLDGTVKTVNSTNAAYLNTALPASESFALTTVADYTFVVNTSKVVTALATTSPARPFEALINVKLGNYGKTYTISINGTVRATFTTPTGSTAADIPKLDSAFIAADLLADLVTAGFNTAPWSVIATGGVIYLKNTTTDFTVACTDGFGGQGMVAIKDNLQKFSDLPADARIDGFSVKITGEAASGLDDYWVRYDAKGVNSATGVWRETIAPGTPLGLDALTMPHLLVREADGTFTFKPATWAQRTVGDALSNPNPTFVGATINDTFFFQNRLGFLADENYIKSETGEYFNFYRTTLATLLDSDPIDVSAATNKVAILKHAVGFNKQLLLFSSQQQFAVDGGELMTPKNVPIKPTTDFAVSTRSKPVAAGRNIYFAQDKGLWSTVREYFADQSNEGNDATDITAHVPNYIPSGIVKIASGSTEDMLVVLTAGDRTRLFVYKYFFSGAEKLQSSWSAFSLAGGGTVLSCDFIGSTLYLVVSRPAGVFFEKMDFSAGAKPAGEPYRVALDRKLQIGTGSLSFDGTRTIINNAALPYVPADGSYMAVAHGGGTIRPGQLIAITHAGGVTSTLGDYTASPMSFGQKFMWRYTLSPLTIKTAAPGGGTKSDTEGRTQVRRIAFNHADTGYYEVLVTPEARQTYAYPFAGKVLGSVSTVVGTPVLPTGRHIAPVMSKNTTVNITLESDLPLPVAILSADWEAFYVKRSQPV